MTGTAIFLCDYQAPYGGNFIASLRALEQKLNERGVQSVYLFPEGAAARPWYASLRAAGGVVETFRRERNAFALGGFLASILKKYRADVLYVHFSKYAASALAALLCPSVRLVWHYHSDFSQGKAAPLSKRIKRRIAGAAVHCLGKRLTRIAVAPHIAAHMPACTVLPNAVAPTRMIAAHTGRAEMRERLSLEEADLFLLLFGWSPAVKGVDLAAETAAYLNKRGVRAVLGIVGGREYTEPRMREWIASHTACTAAEPFLRYLPPTEDVFAYHEAADVMLSASRSEANPYSLLEALFSCRPCAVTDIPGTAFLRGVPGVYFAQDRSKEAMAAAVQSAAALVHDADGRAKLNQAKALVETQYAIGPWTERVVSLLGF